MNIDNDPGAAAAALGLAGAERRTGVFRWIRVSLLRRTASAEAGLGWE